MEFPFSQTAGPFATHAPRAPSKLLDNDGISLRVRVAALSLHCGWVASTTHNQTQP
eukprot:m.35627 g.35627  ORF g.35627 m.35627 type:complete len:56 (-) comp10937_c0_seq1:98-265(-)